MIPDIYFDDVSMLSCGWLRESIDFPAPQPQNDILTVPGRNSPIRYAEALGRISYQPREFTVVLSMLGTHARFIERSSDIINRFNGRLVNVTKSEDPEVYAVGTLLIQPSYDALTGKGIVTISCTDADAYLYHVTETVQSVTGNASIVLDNDFMPVVPTVTTTAQTTLSWSVSGDSFAKTLSAGTWTIPELELQAGSNTITVSGAGTTTFRYREGRL